MPAKLTPAALRRARNRAAKHFIARPGSSAYEERFELGQVLRIQRSGHEMVWCQYARGKRAKLGDPRVLTLERIAYLAREVLQEVHDNGGVLKRDLKKATLGRLIEHDYSPWLRANRRNPDKTLAALRRDFGFLFDRRLTDISRGDLDAFVSSRRSEGVSAATVVRSLNNLRGALRLALDRGYLRETPFKGWRKPRVEDNGITRYLDAEEERRLRAALAERDDRARAQRRSANDWRAERGYELLPEFSEKDFPDHLTPMVLVTLNTGLRYGELAALEWDAVDLKQRVLTVVGRTSKSAKARHVPLNAEAFDVLTRWKAQGNGEGLVFRNPDGTRIRSVKTAWGRLLKEAKIENFRWHDLRHTFASKLVQRGVDLAVVRELLGHSDFKLTLRYAHLEPRQKAEAVAMLLS